MNGFLNINKPFGISSAKCINILKKKFNLKDKIGHMGTLDPNATGVLVVGIKRATRLFDYMLNKKKTYVATFEFGYETETLDAESDVITKKSDIIPNKEDIIKAIKNMVGKQNQIAPKFSAKNINGKRAYQIARQGQDFEIKPHEIEIYDFKLLEQKNKTTFVFEIECSGGTYIRSICRDLANSLGSVATMIALKRTKCGDFCIENSKNIDEVCENDLIAIDFALKELDKIELDDKEIQKIKNGLKIKTSYKSGKYKIYDSNSILGIAFVDENGYISMQTWLV